MPLSEPVALPKPATPPEPAMPFEPVLLDLALPSQPNTAPFTTLFQRQAKIINSLRVLVTPS
jgi:hypothetical protein